MDQVDPNPVRTQSIAQLRERYLNRQRIPGKQILAVLESDPREGVRRLHRALLELRRQRDRESRRQQKMYARERQLWEEGCTRICGVDEAGVGCLAGPVVAAAVVLPIDQRLKGINDSKQLDRECRDRFAGQIRASTQFAVGVASPAEVDEINVYWAGLLAMRRAVERLRPAPEYLLVDARQIPGVDIPQDAVVKGDTKHASIAAASIIAKTERDRLMGALAVRYPGYGFENHKGYCTPEHQEQVRARGLSPIHRVSYSYLDELTGRYSKAFYRLQSRIQEVGSEEEWARTRRQFQARRQDLSASEQKKLLLMLNRRSKGFPQLQQMSLLTIR